MNLQTAFQKHVEGKGTVTVMCSDCNNLLQTLFRNLIPVLLQIDSDRLLEIEVQVAKMDYSRKTWS